MLIMILFLNPLLHFLIHFKILGMLLRLKMLRVVVSDQVGLAHLTHDASFWRSWHAFAARVVGLWWHQGHAALDVGL